MGVDMELDFDKFCKVGRSPRTVLTAPRHQKKSEHRPRREKPSTRNDDYALKRLEEEGFTELKFRNYRSISCKNLPSGDVELECNEPVRRGSVYHGSRERQFRSETRGGRKKIEFSLGGDSSFSFGILDSICGSDEEVEAEPEQNRASTLPLNSGTACTDKPPRHPYSVDFRDRQSGGGGISAERDSMVHKTFKCEQVSGPSNNANILRDKDLLALNKSLSARLALPHSPTRSEGNRSKGSPKSRFTPFRKMFDPITKSRSNRNPSSDDKSAGLMGIERPKTLRKSLLQDFSGAVPDVDSATQTVERDQQQVVPTCSPAHLNAKLKMEHKHGVPYFEFSMAQSEDVIVAKTWKAEDALNWVYTFHSVNVRKRSNASGWGMKYSNKDSPMIGQMQVKCFLCSEKTIDGGFRESMMTEFVLYDIAHARKSVTAKEDISSPEISKVSVAPSEGSVEGNVELDDLFDPAKPRQQKMNAVDYSSADFSTPYPLSPTDLHPNLEIAAVVVQVPFEKRESLKYKRGDKFDYQVHRSLLDLSPVHEGRKGFRVDNDTVKVNVVAPSGNHSLPDSGENIGPSPLLDRWRLGGGCDCGGWDMACPLVVFDSPHTRCTGNTSLLEENLPLKLYVQGGKENLPALTITITDKGQYAVDFHAQLSALQAFAVSVAILHTTEACSLGEQEKNKQLVQCSSLKVLVDDEVKILIESVTEEEKRKVAKPAQENASTFVLNPPFSPIARV